MPKAKITKEMITDAAFEIARADGAENINARTVSKRLNCSTQPVLYYFDTIEEIRHEVFKKAESYHTSYFMKVQGEYDNPLIEIAMRYIKFAIEEKNLFRFLFQSDKFINRDLNEWSGDEKIKPIIQMIGERAGVSKEQAKDLFISIYMMMHGYAAMYANNSMEFDELQISTNIQRVFRGIINVMIKDKI